MGDEGIGGWTVGIHLHVMFKKPWCFRVQSTNSEASMVAGPGFWRLP